MPKKFNVGPYDSRHRDNLARRARRVQRLFDAAASRAAQTAASTLAKADPSGEFRFEDYPVLKRKVDALLRDLGDSLQTNIEEGDRESWTLSNAKNDAMVAAVAGKSCLPGATVRAWTHPHLEALSAFIDRKEAGMNLSRRVWNLTEQFRGELELALELGMGEGKSAAELSRDVRRYLKYPDKLFRRVRDKSGALRLSKAAAAFHPGRGVYRSSYKNALRMTATENNIAYRTADHTRWQSLPFVLGIEVHLSNNHPTEDICDIFDGKRFPKDFKFTGWHPWCRCYAVSVLATEEEMDAYTRAIIDGKDVSGWQFPGKVETMPREFDQWLKDNEERIAKAKSMPYFIKDNFKEGDPTKGVRWENGVKRNISKGLTQTKLQPGEMDKLSKQVGVELGAPMEHAKADMKHPNPHYGDGEEFRVNCQSCVVAYELRRRGLPVEAFGRKAGSMGEQLAHNTRAAWLDAEGNIPELTVCKQEIKNRTIDRRGYVRTTYTTDEDVWKDFMSKTAETGRYHLRWTWKGKDVGHIITMETFADGTRLFYDPQTGLESKNIMPWIIRKNKVAFDMKKGIGFYRVDKLQPNSLVVKGVVKKAGCSESTPMMSMEQKEWWKKTVGKLSGNVNGATPLSPEERLRRKEIKAIAKGTLRNVKMYHDKFDNAITISGGKINEWLNQPFEEYSEKNEALLKLPKLLENSKYLGWGEDEHDVRIKMHLFETKIGKTKSWIVVRSDTDGESIVHSISDQPSILKFITHHVK